MALKLCKYQCSTMIQWDTKLNAFIEEDGRLHDVKRCKDLRGDGSSAGSVNTSTVSSTVVLQRLDVLEGNTQGIQLSVDKLNERLDALTRILMNMKIGQKNLDPFNDDGDSIRGSLEGSSE